MFNQFNSTIDDVYLQIVNGGQHQQHTGYDNNDVAAEGTFCLHRNDFWKMTALWTDAVMLLHTLGGKQLVNG